MLSQTHMFDMNYVKQHFQQELDFFCFQNMEKNSVNFWYISNFVFHNKERHTSLEQGEGE